MIKNLLLADDDVEECFLFKSIVYNLDPTIYVATVNDGDKVAEALNIVRPDVVFLDLNMPCKNGIQCLQELQENQVYRFIPVVVYSTSGRPQDINQAYGFGASLYVKKPSMYKDLVETLRDVLSLDWTNPMKIKEQHFIANQYLPYSLGEV